MIPGFVSKLTEVALSLTNTIRQTGDIMRVSSTATTTVLVTLTPAIVQTNLVCFLINNSGGTMTATTAGNIATTCSIPNGNMCVMVFSRATGKWHVDKTT